MLLFIISCLYFVFFFTFFKIFSYQPKLTNLLDVMNNYKHVEKLHSHHDITLQSIGLVLQFIHHVIKLKNESFNALYPNLINQTLHWAQFENLHQQAMLIFQTIIINLRINNSSIDQNLQRDIYEQLEESLDVSKIMNIDFFIKY